MSSSDIALSLKKITKDFNLPHEKQNSLKERVLSFKKPSYEKLHVLKDIDLEVKKGEFFGIVGRNGSGKSTLLKIIGGIYQPTSGEVKVNGTLTPFIELGIGFNPDLTGRENVFLNGAILGLSRKEIKQKYHEIIEFAELEKFMDQKLKNYSSGMQVRLAFSIAMQAHNDILLMDEVLAVGDASFQRKCFEVFKNMKQIGKTVIFVTHDMGAVREYCDRAMLIENGKIISKGQPDKVANDYIQLFNKDAVTSEENSKSARWGDQKVSINNVKVAVQGNFITIHYSIKASQNVQDPIIGVIIRDLDNNHIFDNNTKWKNIKTGSLAKGDTWGLDWTIPNILKSGRYKVTLAVAHQDGLGFHDWQDDVHSFNISRKEITAGLIVVNDKLVIKK